MCLNKSKGHMYSWVDYTYNPIKGRCPHDCKYCYMKKYWNKIGKLRLDEKCLKTNLGSGNVIFIGSSTDMWANDVPDEWILKVLQHCIEYSENTYLFQSKNPQRFIDFYIDYEDFIPENVIFGTTIETNRDYGISKAPSPYFRYMALSNISNTSKTKKMVSIEPIMDFDLEVLILWMEKIQPSFISIGADSKHNNLPEPPAWKVMKLIEELRKITKVKVKLNLNRIIHEEEIK